MPDVSEPPAALAESAAPTPEPAAVSGPGPVAAPGPVAGPAPAAGPRPLPEPLPASVPAAAPYPPPLPAYAPQAVARPGGMSPRVRVALRWTSVLLVFAVFGAGTAYAVTRPERTKIPGLKTPDDGRWTYPQVALPKLPARKPRPLDAALNPGGVHYADVRSLLLAPPGRAVNDPAFPGTTGWLTVAAFLKVRVGGGGSQQELFLKEQGLRHVAGRAWTMPDGTRTEVYLAQFISAGYATYYDQDADLKPIDGVTTDRLDTGLADRTVPRGVKVAGYDETAPYGDSMTRYAFLVAGDTVALVRQTRKGGEVPEQAFRQTVRLQAQLLG
ncbi:hypothetical protein [Streptomyces sp. IBSBF 2435]|uniref:hypothetical protein n=1 Tax=Streptomyces sp. IBSBF 2435 TaxID=2903531 RepID=UPI002FDC02F3